MDAEAVHEAVAALGGQTVTDRLIGAAVEFKTRASNSKGHADSAVKGGERENFRSALFWHFN